MEQSNWSRVYSSPTNKVISAQFTRNNCSLMGHLKQYLKDLGFLSTNNLSSAPTRFQHLIQNKIFASQKKEGKKNSKTHVNLHKRIGFPPKLEITNSLNRIRRIHFKNQKAC